MSETGDKLNAAYRALPREESGHALDAAILAASRRALAKPSASRRWAAPVSIAAVLVLAFGVTLHMQHEKPGVESPEMYSSPPAAAKVPMPVAEPEGAKRAVTPDMLKQEAPPAQPLRDAKTMPEKKVAKVVVPEAKPDFVAPPPKAKLQEAPAPQQAAPARPQAFEEDKARQRRDEGRAETERSKDLLQKESSANISTTTATGSIAFAPPPPAVAASSAAAPAVAAPAAPAAPTPSSRASAASEMRLKREAATGVRGLSADEMQLDEPTRELEAIAKLRTEGRNEEADKALAEFRKKRPDYRIPDAMWERVKPR